MIVPFEMIVPMPKQFGMGDTLGVPVGTGITCIWRLGTLVAGTQVLGLFYSSSPHRPACSASLSRAFQNELSPTASAAAGSCPAGQEASGCGSRPGVFDMEAISSHCLPHAAGNAVTARLVTAAVAAWSC